MNLLDCIEKRVSSRQYQSTPISNNVIKDILNAAHYAPSPKNRQPWRFVVLTGSEKDAVVHVCRKSLKSHSTIIKYLLDDEKGSESRTFDIIDIAPVLILVFNAFPSKQTLYVQNYRFDCANIQAIGAAIQNMLLRATELGIGSLWIGDIFAAANDITQRYFDTGDLVAGVVLGVSRESSARTNRRPLSDLVVFNGGQK